LEEAVGKIRVGVIGAGSWTVASHLPNLARHDDVEFVAVARKGADLLTKIKHDYGFELASEDYQDVLDAGVDVCIVASPSGLHHEHAAAALRAGAHVMCEKPFTLNPGDAWDLDAIAAEQSRELVISFGWNYRPMVQRAKAMMDEYGIGELEQLSVFMASATRDLLSNRGAYPDAAPEAVPEQATWTDRRLSGGGYGQAQLSHALGMALWLTGARAASGFALETSPLDAPVELHNAITYTYDGGAIGVVSGGSAHTGAWGNKHSLEVRGIGSAGQFLIDVEREAFWLHTEGEDRQLEVTPGEGLYDCSGPIDAVLAAARGDQFVNQSPAELGARTVEALDIAYRSAGAGAVAYRA
jgi:predicted dehydrogenase